MIREHVYQLTVHLKECLIDDDIKTHSVFTCVVHLELASTADLFLELLCLGIPQGVLEPVHSDPKDEIS